MERESTQSESAGTEPQAQDGTKDTLKDKLWSGTFILIIFLTFIGYMVNQGLNTGSTVYLSYIGETAGLAGIGAAVFSIAGGFARFFGGKTIDTKGRAKCVIAGMAIMVIFSILPIANYSGIAFVLIRLMQGIGFGISTTAIATAAADVLPLSRLNEGIGYSGLGQAIAMSMGPAFALTLVDMEPHSILFWGLFIISIVGFLVSFFLRYEKNPKILPENSTYRKRWEEMKRANAESTAVVVKEPAQASATTAPKDARESITEKLDEDDISIKGWRKYIELSALPGAIPILLFCPCMGFMIYFGGLFGNTMGLGNVGLFFTFSAITMIVIRISSKAFMNTVPPIIIMGVAALAAFISYAIMVAVSLGTFGDASRTVFLATGILYGFSGGLATPINQAIAVGNSSATRWGAANATYFIAFDIGIGISSILWGALSDMFGFTFVLICIMVCIVVAWISAIFLYPKKKSRNAAS